MKISKKDLRRIILEAMGTPGRSTARARRVTERQRRSRRRRVNTTSSDRPADADAAATAGETDNVAAVAAANTEPSNNKTKSKPKSNSKTAYIQKVIGAPSAEGKDQGDGQWGTNTTDAWKEWVVTDDTIKKIEMLKSKKESPGESTVDENKKFSLSFLFEQEDRPGESETSEDSEIAKFVYKNRGNAAAIAKELGYPSTLSGVEKMVRDLEAQPVESDTSDEESEESSGEDSDKKIDVGDIESATAGAGLKGMKAENNRMLGGAALVGTAGVNAGIVGSAMYGALGAAGGGAGAALASAGWPALVVLATISATAVAAAEGAKAFEERKKAYQKATAARISQIIQGASTNYIKRHRADGSMTPEQSQEIYRGYRSKDKEVAADHIIFSSNDLKKAYEAAKGSASDEYVDDDIVKKYVEGIKESIDDEYVENLFPKKSKVAESLSHGALIRKRYWGRY